MTANFAINTYTVTYNGNGNTAGTAPALQSGNYNTSVTLAGAGTLVRTGYSFNGWNALANGTGIAYAAGASFTLPASSTTLYAQWLQLTPLENWRQTWYNTVNNSGNAADTAAPYGTGIPNLAVFAFLGPGQNPATARPSQLPQAQTSGGNVVFGFTQPGGVSGITFGAEWSTTLQPGSWTAISDTGNTSAIPPQHRFSMPMGTNTKLFLRLRVTNP